MTDQYFVLKRIPTGDTKVPFAEALEAYEKEKNRTPCHNCGSRQYEWYHRNKDRAHCSECAELKEPPKIDPITLPENYFVILESHPDKPDTRVPCDKCGHTEFTRIGSHDLYCSKCSTMSPLGGERKPSCLSCGSTDYVWYFDNGESAYCSKCSPDTPPPPKPLLKFLPCPECNRMLTTLSEHLPPGRCCLCGAELSPPVCPHCGHNVFHPHFAIHQMAMFKADGTLSCPSLYFFRCAKCWKPVGNLPLKRTDK